MTVENWQGIYSAFTFMCYLGVVTTSVNLFIKVFIERRSLKRWFGGTIITSVIGVVLFGVSFGIFGFLSSDPLKRKLFYHFVMMGALMPIWMDPVFSIKFILDKQRYSGNPKQTVSVLKYLALFSLLVLAGLSAEKWFNQDTLLSVKTFVANKSTYFSFSQDGLLRSLEEHKLSYAIGIVLLFLYFLRKMNLSWLMPYDFFISYKSKDVSLARKVADQLIASGHKVWFAEYEILLKKRKDFQKAIDRGLKRAKYGIALTNDAYIDSSYCRDEIEQLLKHCGADKIIEIQIPKDEKPHKFYPDLRNSHRFVYYNNFVELLGYIKDKAKINIVAFNENNNADGEYMDSYVSPITRKSKTYHLQTPGWTFQKMADRLSPLSIPGPCMQYNNKPFFINLYIGPEVDPNARSKFDNPDDRKMYDALIDYSAAHLKKFMGTKIKGVHLIWHKSGNNFAITYKQKFYWTRKTSIILKGPDVDELTEFTFTFGFLGSFENYCLYAHIMDDLATSVKWINN